jgi:threonine dehydratase
VVPNNAPKSKADAIKDYGAELVWCEPTPKDRYNHGFISLKFY